MESADFEVLLRDLTRAYKLFNEAKIGTEQEIADLLSSVGNGASAFADELDARY